MSKNYFETSCKRIVRLLKFVHFLCVIIIIVCSKHQIFEIILENSLQKKICPSIPAKEKYAMEFKINEISDFLKLFLVFIFIFLKIIFLLSPHWIYIASILISHLLNLIDFHFDFKFWNIKVDCPLPANWFHMAQCDHIFLKVVPGRLSDFHSDSDFFLIKF